MKYSLTQIIKKLFLLVVVGFLSNANALIINDKDWEFASGSLTWNQISNLYDTNGLELCGITPCASGKIWADFSELNELFTTASTDDLITANSFGGPLLLGEMPSLGLGLTFTVWHGWLRNEDLTDPLKASSAVIEGGCTPTPAGPCTDKFLGTLSEPYLPKTYADEGASGGPAITGYWAYSQVDEPSAILLFSAGLASWFFLLRRKSRS
jgi:hypothetical protein